MYKSNVNNLKKSFEELLYSITHTIKMCFVFTVDLTITITSVYEHSTVSAMAGELDYV